MSNVKLMAVGAGALMLAFYLTKRKELQTGQARPGYIFDGYGYVPANAPYNFR